MADAVTNTFTCHVLPGSGFVVTSGANLGDPFGDAGDLNAGDTYRLDVGVQAVKLAVADGGSGAGRVLSPDTDSHRVAPGSEIGRQDAPVTLAARLTLLAPEGHQVELLLIDIDGNDTRVGGTAILPIGPVEPGRDHTLIAVNHSPGPVRLADITSVAFGRGTRITGADGRLHPIESLQVGDRLLTRDHGPQTLRWIAHRTLRGVGPHAPVVIPNDVLGNSGVLVLSQHQRLFIYQRAGERLTENAEMLVKAGYLVDSETIFLREGGFVDYYTLVFDRHEVIYAECLPVESLEVSAATLPALPEDLAREVHAAVPDLRHVPHVGTEVDRATAEATRTRLLRRGGPA